jgi:predicted HicB family RNase H-like nuclease
MAIAKNPVRKGEKKAEAFISGAGKGSEEAGQENKKPTMIRVDPALRERVDKACAKLGGISFSAFVTLSLTEKLDRMEQ